MHRLALVTVSIVIGLVAGLGLPSLLAQEPKVQKWEQFCEPGPFKSVQPETTFKEWKSYTNERGSAGYELIAPPTKVFGYMTFCYRRAVK